MSQIFPIRFGPGQGLEARGNERSQQGLIELQNVDLTLNNTVEKRTGAESVTLQRSSDPADLIPADQLRALWYRDQELVLETDRELYSRQLCISNDAAPIESGTATAQEKTDASNAVLSPTTFVISPGTDPETGNVKARLAAKVQFENLLDFGVDNIDFIYDESPTGAPQVTVFGPGTSIFTYRLRARADTVNQVVFVPDSPTPDHVQVIYYGQEASSPFRNMVFFDVFDATGPVVAYNNDSNFVKEYSAGFPGQKFGVDKANRLAAIPSLNQIRTVRFNVAAFDTFVYTSLSLKDQTPCDIDIWTTDVINGPHYVGMIADFEDDSTSDTTLLYTELDPGGGFPLTITNFAIAAPSTSLDGNTRLAVLESSAAITDRGVMVWDSDLVVNPVFGFDPTVGELTFADSDNDDIEIRIIHKPSGITVYEHYWNDQKVTSRTLALTGTGTQLPTANNSDWVEFGLGLYGILYGNSVGYELQQEDSLNVSIPILTQSAAGGYDQATAFASANRFGHATFTPSGVFVSQYNAFGGVSNDGTVVVNDADKQQPFSVDVITEINPNSSTERIAFFNLASELEFGSMDPDNAASYVKEASFPFPEIPADIHVNVSPAGGMRTIIGVRYDSNSIEVYEYDTDLFVRVSPPLFSLPGGEWSFRGPWSRNLQRITNYKQYALSIVNIEASQILSGDNVCTLAVSEVINEGVILDVVGKHLEPSQVLDSAGRKPKIGKISDSRVVFSYLSSINELFFQNWAATEPIDVTTTGLILGTANRVYDQHTREVGGVGYVAWVAVENEGTYSLQIRDGNDAIVIDQTILSGFGDTRDAVVYILPDQGGTDFYVAVGLVGAFGVTPLANIAMFEVTPGTPGSALTLWATSFTPGDQPRAISAIADEPTTIRSFIEVENTPTRNIEFWESDDTLPSTEWRDPLFGAAINSTVVNIAGKPAAWVSLLSDERSLRSGLYLYAPGESIDTHEIIARAFVGQGEDITLRNVRATKNTLNVGANSNYTFGAGIVVDQTPVQAAFIDTIPIVSGNAPAIVDSTAISAHAGYPRAYDGVSVFEHDWHELPIYTPTITVQPGSIDAGTYGIAVTFRWSDVRGRIYRSRPTFESLEVPSDNSSFAVTLNPILTERPNVYAEVWRTLKNQSGVYYLTSTALMSRTSSISLASGSNDATVSDNELLDEVSLGLAPSDPIPSTDFVSFASGRLWTRDPERGSVSRFTVPRREGFGMSWTIDQVIEASPEGNLSNVSEMGGRLVFSEPQEVSYVTGEGPNLIGIGSFPEPVTVPTEIGTDRHESVALTSLGLTFGSSRGPKLLTQGLNVINYGQPIENRYIGSDFGQRVISANYVPNDGTLYLFDNGAPASERRSLRWHPESKRWSLDTFRQAFDSTVSSDGTLAILTTDNRVLVADDSYGDGETGYITSVRTPWIRETSPASLRPRFDFKSIAIFGKYLGPHELRVELFFDYSDTPTFTYTVPADKTALNNARGNDYIYVAAVSAKSCFAVSARVYDTGEPNATFRLEGIDFELVANKSTSPARLSADYQFEQLPE